MDSPIRRKVVFATALAALAAAPAAQAKRTQFSVLGGPAHARAAWHARIVVTVSGRPYRGRFRPVIGLLDGSGAVIRLFPSKRTAQPGVFAASVVFPRVGTWRYWIADGVEGGDWYFRIRVTA